ncbi:uncharacterized protein LOC122864857 isoform X2 [Siniperca chuatsi]|uniref:uncharacterized protein LOC122864857 isoform X2 n=1 Tax=Siniperca chuatsi TaxID=119488 RepID=UPI001CE06210|nr:uncharacterized protein LOC122864857 isoform X2 [Siniperca chuatsi]
MFPEFRCNILHPYSSVTLISYQVILTFTVSIEGSSSNPHFSRTKTLSSSQSHCSGKRKKNSRDEWKSVSHTEAPVRSAAQFDGLYPKMFSLMIFCHVWFLHTVLICCGENATGTVIRFSVPEDHHVCLQWGSDSSDVVWSHQDRKVLVTRQGSYETNEDPQRYRLQPDGSLRLLQLDDSDSGEYHCNQRLVAELQVLTGHDFMVSAGRTLLLPCSGSSKPKQRWIHRREGGRREAIFTRFRNGTVTPEKEGSRLSYENDALQIQDLQPEDAGEYLCNGKLLARVTVLTVQPEPTSIQQTTSTTATPAVMNTDGVEIKKKKKRPENALLVAVVVGLGLMILLMAAVCVLLTSVKCRRKKKYGRAAAAQRHEDTELQPWKTSKQTECEVYVSASLPEETIHYASLGRQNWRERPSKTPPDQSHHDVIYSSVITRPAAR